MSHKLTLHTILFATFLLLWSALANAAPLQCIFQQSATVEKESIRLGDIVRFNQENETTKALASLVVGDSPQPGERILLRSVTIRNTLLRNHAIPGGTQWRGSGTVSVFRKGQRLESGQILGYIDAYLQENSALLPQAAIRFLPQSAPMPFALPTGDVSCEVIPSHPGILRSSRFSLIFRIQERTVKNISVRGKIEAVANVAVARKNLQRGEAISSESYRLSSLDISRIPDAVIDPALLNGKKLLYPLRPGQPIRTSMLEEIPVIFKGEPVKITIRSHSMLLTATGFALTDGAKNAVIRVQNNNSRKILRAQVVGPGVVEIKI